MYREWKFEKYFVVDSIGLMSLPFAMSIGKTKQSVCVSTTASPNGKARSVYMFGFILKLLGIEPGTKVVLLDIAPKPVSPEPRFYLPETIIEYRKQVQAFRDKLAEYGRKIEELENKPVSTDPIQAELDARLLAATHREMNLFGDQQSMIRDMSLEDVAKIDAKTRFELREMCIRENRFPQIQKALREAEAMTIMKRGIEICRTKTPKRGCELEERVVIYHDQRVFLLCFSTRMPPETLSRVMKGFLKTTEPTEMNPQTSVFNWITDSLQQLSDEELNELKTEGVICKN